MRRTSPATMAFASSSSPHSSTSPSSRRPTARRLAALSCFRPLTTRAPGTRAAMRAATPSPARLRDPEHAVLDADRVHDLEDDLAAQRGAALAAAAPSTPAAGTATTTSSAAAAASQLRAPRTRAPGDLGREGRGGVARHVRRRASRSRPPRRRRRAARRSRAPRARSRPEPRSSWLRSSCHPSAAAHARCSERNNVQDDALGIRMHARASAKAGGPPALPGHGRRRDGHPPLRGRPPALSRRRA